MIDLLDPWDIISILSSFGVSIWLMYLYKKCGKRIFLIMSFLMYIVLAIKFMVGIPGYNGPYIAIIYGIIIYWILRFHYDKMYTLAAITTFGVIIQVTFGYVCGVEFHGQNAMFLFLVTYTWYMNMKHRVCFNPFDCPQKRIKML